ncbi:MAG TPA: hypothetical protein PK156_31085 [Polyangium sp.]|nr:hypothetical protein [Polyangium sp.]
MSRLLLIALASLLVPACSRSIDDSCAVLCEKNALCEPGTDEKFCVSVCKETANGDDPYAEAISRQADCLEENAGYYEDPKGLCVAIAGGVCNTIVEQ